MPTVKETAKRLFEDYSLKTTGQIANWYKLSDERKLSWMREVVDQFSLIVEDFRDRAGLGKPVPPESSNTSYAMGLRDGTLKERLRMLQVLEGILTDNMIEVEDFENALRQHP